MSKRSHGWLQYFALNKCQDRVYANENRYPVGGAGFESGENHEFDVERGKFEKSLNI